MLVVTFVGTPTKLHLINVMFQILFQEACWATIPDARISNDNLRMILEMINIAGINTYIMISRIIPYKISQKIYDLGIFHFTIIAAQIENWMMGIYFKKIIWIKDKYIISIYLYLI